MLIWLKPMETAESWVLRSVMEGAFLLLLGVLGPLTLMLIG
jgi:hypothetical protein